MKPEERNYAYIWDMLQAAQELLDMNEGSTYDDFIDDIKLMRATERGLEIIGEAARRLTLEFIAQHTDIQWHMMIGQRNIIAHEYGQIDYEMLYRTVVDDIPVMITQLKLILPEEEDEIINGVRLTTVPQLFISSSFADLPFYFEAVDHLATRQAGLFA